jgi:hypothetical protein
MNRRIAIFAGIAGLLAAALVSPALAQNQADDSFFAGHITPIPPQNVANSGLPILSNCGTTPTLSATSSDAGGTINVGSGAVTSCTLTFAQPYSNATPSYVVSGTTSGLAPTAASVTARSLTAITISTTASVGSGTIDYFGTGR